jgi:hypothetical protein
MKPISSGRRGGRRRRSNALALLALVANFVQEGGVGGLREATLLVEEHEHAGRRHLLDEVDAGLVVAVVDLRETDLLAGVLVLLEPKDVLVEVGLELLVGVVDAELLEGVHFEVLKSKDVEHADEILQVRLVDRLVDVHHQPLEQPRVQRFHQCIARVDRLVVLQRNHRDLTLHIHRSLQQRALQLGRLHTTAPKPSTIQQTKTNKLTD